MRSVEWPRYEEDHHVQNVSSSLKMGTELGTSVMILLYNPQMQMIRR